MKMSIPKYKIKQTITYFKDDGVSIDMGTIKNISVVMREDGTSQVYYHVLDSKNIPTPVAEDVIINNARSVRQPAYSIGDKVIYQAYIKESNLTDCEGIIESINIVQHADGDDVYYIMDDDADYLVPEEDIEELVGYTREDVV